MKTPKSNFIDIFDHEGFKQFLETLTRKLIRVDEWKKYMGLTVS